MKYLLDTHTFIWFITQNRSLSKIALERIEAPESSIALSIASLWEISIKYSIGKLPLPTSDVIGFLRNELISNQMVLLTIQPSHVFYIIELPQYHRDPFDRLLIAQSFLESMPIIGADEKFDRYGIERIW